MSLRATAPRAWEIRAGGALFRLSSAALAVACCKRSASDFRSGVGLAALVAGLVRARTRSGK